MRLLILGCLLFSSQVFARTLDLSALSEPVRESVYKFIPALRGPDFTWSDLDALVRVLITQEHFDSAEVQQLEGDNFKIKVSRTKRIGLIKVTGNSAISETEALNQFAVAEKSNFDQEELVNAAERLRRLYAERAFHNAVIDLEFQTGSETDVNIELKITENKQTKIKKIEIDCANSALRNQTYSRLKGYLGDPMTDATVQEMRQRAKEDFAEDRYLKSELLGPELTLSRDESEATLKFKIDKADIYEMEFRGNSQFINNTLMRALDLDNFFSSNPTIGPELATKLKNFYLSKGYARVQVFAEEYEKSRPYARGIRFQISEGPQVKIRRIDFQGRFSQPETFYSKLLLENASDLLKSYYYNRDDLDTAFKNLTIERQNEGYLKAKVVSMRAAYSTDHEHITITVNFDEGPLTSVKDIVFEGLNAFTAAELEKIVNLERNKPLRLNKLEESIETLKSFYKSRGYLEMSLANEREDLVNYSMENTLATLKFKIAEGPQVMVGSILVEGNTLTKTYVIQKELEFKEGDVLTPQKIEETTRRLQRLGIFSSVDVRTLEEKTQISHRTVIVRVQDRDPGLFNTGIGVSNERQLTLRGYLGVAYRNIGGTGRAASARIDANYNIADIKYLERKATLGYLEPYLMDTRNRGRVNFIQSDTINATWADRAVQLRQFSFSVEQDITSNILLSWDLWNKATYRDYAIKPLSIALSNGTARSYDVNEDISRVEIASIGPTLEINFRDHPFNPTKGTFTRVSLEYANPTLGSSSTIEYYRALATFTHYLPITKSGSWVWANSIQGGHLKNLNQDPNGGVPYDKKGLALGGQSTIRGFSPGESFPNVTDFGNITNVNQDPYLLKTAATSVLFKSELKFPVPIYPNVVGALFYDGGAVWVQGVGFNDPYRDAVGIALRYATPVGAIGLDWAFKLDRNSSRDESTNFLHLTMGTF